jgi:hypothetical protein
MISMIQSPPLTIPAGDVQPTNVPQIAIPFSLLLAQQVPLMQARTDAVQQSDVQPSVQATDVPIMETAFSQPLESGNAWTMIAAMPIVPQIVSDVPIKPESDRDVDNNGMPPVAVMGSDVVMPVTPQMIAAPIPQSTDPLSLRTQATIASLDAAKVPYFVARDAPNVAPMEQLAVERLAVERLDVERLAIERMAVDLKKTALEAIRSTDRDGRTADPLTDQSVGKTDVIRATLSELGGGTITVVPRTLPNAHTMLGALHFAAPIAHMVVAEDEPKSEQTPIVVPARVDTAPITVPAKTEPAPITGWASFDDVLRTQLQSNNPNIATQAVIRLSPEHLGNVEVQLSMQQGALQATFVTESVHAKEALEGQLSSLRQQLTLHGVTVERMIVAENSAYTMQSQQQFDQRHSRNKQHNEQQEHAEIEVANEWNASLRASVQQWRNGSFSTIA